MTDYVKEFKTWLTSPSPVNVTVNNNRYTFINNNIFIIKPPINNLKEVELLLETIKSEISKIVKVNSNEIENKKQIIYYIVLYIKVVLYTKDVHLNEVKRLETEYSNKLNKHVEEKKKQLEDDYNKIITSLNSLLDQFKKLYQ